MATPTRPAATTKRQYPCEAVRPAPSPSLTPTPLCTVKDMAYVLRTT